jgi:hypothetical protein
LLLAAAVLAACGDSSLAPGQSVTLASGQSVKVPAGTMIRVSGSVTVSGERAKLSFDGTMVTISGDNGTVTTSAGAVISVPADAIGPADNTVTAK